MCISHNIAISFHCHTCWLEFKMPLPQVKKQQKTLACIKKIQDHKLSTKVYSQKGLTAMDIYIYFMYFIFSYFKYTFLNLEPVYQRKFFIFMLCKIVYWWTIKIYLIWFDSRVMADTISPVINRFWKVGMFPHRYLLILSEQWFLHCIFIDKWVRSDCSTFDVLNVLC